MKMNILVMEDLNEQQITRIREASKGCKVTFVRANKELVHELSDVDIIFAGLFGEFDDEMFRAAKCLKWVQVLGAGVDAILFPEFVESSVILTSGKGWVGPHLAEQAFALLLALTRGIATSIRAKSWDVKWDVRNAAWELTGKTIGIVGFGGTGRDVAVRAAAFGMRSIAIDPEDVEVPDCMEGVWPMERFYDLLSESDVVCICAPLTPKTQGMFNRSAFQKMRRHALLINVTRGNIMDEDALVEALSDGTICGAGLDVTPQEPLPDEHPLWNMSNVVITPHVAGASPHRIERGVDLFCENLKRFLNDEPMLALINKQKGY